MIRRSVLLRPSTATAKAAHASVDMKLAFKLSLLIAAVGSGSRDWFYTAHCVKGAVKARSRRTEDQKASESLHTFRMTCLCRPYTLMPSVSFTCYYSSFRSQSQY